MAIKNYEWPQVTYWQVVYYSLEGHLLLSCTTCQIILWILSKKIFLFFWTYVPQCIQKEQKFKIWLMTAIIIFKAYYSIYDYTYRKYSACIIPASNLNTISKRGIQFLVCLPSVTPCVCHHSHSITRNSPWGQFRLQTVLKFFRRRIARLFFFSSSLSFSLPLLFHSRGAAVFPFLLP